VSKPAYDARALIEAGRNACRPSEVDRARVLDALKARIAQGGVAAPQAAAEAASRGLGWSLSAGVVASAALVGGLIWQQVAPAPATPRALAPALSIQPVVAAHAVAASDPPRESSPDVSAATPASGAESARSASPRAPSKTLAEEVALLSRAETELHAGRFVAALRRLDEYERRFPKGALTQEDVAARVQALCGLGRVDDAQQQLKRLAPGSPHASRARASCGKGRLD